jgi:tetratricopeptide (TPR) repeat protein
MPKTGRNDPCPCGSGKKYKRCCLEKDEAAALAARGTELAAQQASERARLQDLEVEMREAEALTEASNAVVDLVHAGRLDEAERAARDLLVRYPDVHDGYDRLGMVYEARGDHKQAAEYYRKVIEFVHAHPEDYDPEFASTFHELIAKLDPSASAG